MSCLEQPIRLKDNGQINVVLNTMKRGEVSPNSNSIVETVQKPKHELLVEIDEQLRHLIGMEEIKTMIHEIYAWIFINKKREELNLKAEKQVLHMLFKGNPGTGKTTVARIIGQLFLKMGVLSKGHLIEAERADLVGEYIGHTAQKTRDLVKKANGGILFIDEAYSLGRGGEKDFGKEAIDTLVKHMEDKHGDFVLILAGYSSEMDYFLSLNPGLKSRFPFILEFQDYNVKELMDISKKMFVDREYILSREAEFRLRDFISKAKLENRQHFSNGRFVRNIVEKSIRSQATRLVLESEFNREILMRIEEKDLTISDKKESKRESM